MWKCGVFVSGPEDWAPECWFTTRDLGIEAMDDQLPHHCIHTCIHTGVNADAEVAVLLLASHALAGVIPERSRPHCRTLAVVYPLSA